MIRIIVDHDVAGLFLFPNPILVFAVLQPSSPLAFLPKSRTLRTFWAQRAFLFFFFF